MFDKNAVEAIILLYREEMLGKIEARSWIAKIFPEFDEVRDADVDAMLTEQAEIISSQLQLQKRETELRFRQMNNPDDGNLPEE
jgi:hypothetical protein